MILSKPPRTPTWSIFNRFWSENSHIFDGNWDTGIKYEFYDVIGLGLMHESNATTQFHLGVKIFEWLTIFEKSRFSSFGGAGP